MGWEISVKEAAAARWGQLEFWHLVLQLWLARKCRDRWQKR